MPEKLRDGGLALFCALAFAVVGYVAIAYPLTHNLEQLRLGGGWDANLISFSMVFAIAMAVACYFMRRWWTMALMLAPFTVSLIGVALIEDPDGQYMASPLLKRLDDILMMIGPLGLVAGLAVLAWQFGKRAAA